MRAAVGPPKQPGETCHRDSELIARLESRDRGCASLKVISEDSLAEMKEIVVVDPGTSGDGLGIFSSELPCGRFWGHDGGILDYGTIVKASEDGNRVAVISARAPSGPPPNETALLCPSDATTSR